MRVLGYMGGSVAGGAEGEFLAGLCVRVGDCVAGGAEGEVLAEFCGRVGDCMEGGAEGEFLAVGRCVLRQGEGAVW